MLFFLWITVQLQASKSSPIDEKSPNLVTLLVYQKVNN
jgi:hypothetical protein